MTKYIKKFFTLIIFLFFFAISCPKTFSEEIIIRDAEIEDTLTEIARRIFKVAGLREKDAKLYIIQSDSVNAFTIGNGYIFVTSGLLLKFKNPIHLIAVLSHETGHLAGGHIDVMMSRIQNSSSNLMMATIAGILGSIATGSADAMGLLLGYAMTTERLFLRFSREQEQSADSLGATYMEKMGYDPKAMIDVFEAFERMETLGGASNIPAYARTHPRSLDRISSLLNRKKKNNLSSVCDSALSKKYARIVSKLRAYLGDRQNGRYFLSAEEKAESEESKYPKAISLHRKGKSAEAIAILKKLVKDNPKDIYYKETLAQILCESGKTEESIAYYRQIYNEHSNVLIKVDYAKALVQSKHIDNATTAIKILESAKYEDRINPEIFRLLANAYGQKNKKGMSFLMLAQEQMLLTNYNRAYDLLEASIAVMDPKRDAKSIKQAKHLQKIIRREKNK